MILAEQQPRSAPKVETLGLDGSQEAPLVDWQNPPDPEIHRFIARKVAAIAS